MVASGDVSALKDVGFASRPDTLKLDRRFDRVAFREPDLREGRLELPHLSVQDPKSEGRPR
mgnify:CR=1 FL=1